MGIKTISNKKIIFLISFIFIPIFIFLSSQIEIPKTVAQSSIQELSGYAWSDTIGWISFASSTNGNNKVEIDSNGNLNGYAWSENIGWIKFGGLAGINIVSTDGSDVGTTWVQQGTPCCGWLDMASSIDGNIIGGTQTGRFMISLNNGVDWVTRIPTDLYFSSLVSIAMSSDGTKLILSSSSGSGGSGGQIYTSTDSGVNWISRVGAGQRT